MWKWKSKAEFAQESALPEFGHIEKGFRKGRSVYDGYQRGVGIEFGELRQTVMRDRDFQEAYGRAKGRTIVSLERLINLFLIVKFYIPQIDRGHIVEFGSYNGGSALFLATLAKRFLPDTRVFALDTYVGMPVTDRMVDVHVAGEFRSETLIGLRSLGEKYRLDNLEFVQGLFEETTLGVMTRAEHVCLVHVDCDIYDAVKFSYRASKPYVVPKGYIVFDDPTTSTCLGAMEAIEECVIQDDRLHAEQVFPHLVFRQPF